MPGFLTATEPPTAGIATCRRLLAEADAPPSIEIRRDAWPLVRYVRDRRATEHGRSRGAARRLVRLAGGSREIAHQALAEVLGADDLNVEVS